MSFVSDQVRRVDSQLDRLQFSTVSSTPSSPVLTSRSDDFRDHSSTVLRSPRIHELQIVIKALSSATSQTPLGSNKIQALLEQAKLTATTLGAENEADTALIKDLEWLLISKATVQTYGIILNTLLEGTIPLSNDIWYWDDILGSYRYTGLYSIQTSPLRLWGWTKDIYHDARQRLESLRRSRGASVSSVSVTDSWKQFYGLVRQSIQERSIADVQQKMMTPFAMVRAEARHNQRGLKRLKEMKASGLGVLMDECLSFDVDEEGSIATKSHRSIDKEEWKSMVAKSVSLMETVLQTVTSSEVGVGDFEDTVFANVHEFKATQVETSETEVSRPAVLSSKLQEILQVNIPNHVSESHKLARKYGRPSRLTRYWFPATVLLLSSSTILRILANRKAEILTWIREFGVTVKDFWMNWVVEPIKKVIGTIRHDESSEVAIMSKRSLEGDRDSLERMVVEFAADNPNNSTGGQLSDADIADIRAKVKEGDLTPVLKAYERDMKKPFMGAIRGELVRALLIQVQKTKVDVEVAMGGIDALLKSQELVFGFVGLTPGILVCIAVGRYLTGIFGSRQGLKQNKKKGQMVRVLRNIDRILTASTPSSNDMLSYKEHGLLLCEVHILRQHAQRVMPSEINREFTEEINDLVDIRTGVQRQLRVVDRIRWAYSRWLM